jgi:plasmid stabilization system protein ParE
VTGYVLHPEVFDDLDQIYEYIGSFNARAADRVLDELFAAFDSLPLFPHQGRRRPELTSQPLRFKVVRTYLIAYAPELEPLWIVAVIDGRRSPRVIAALLRGRDSL